MAAVEPTPALVQALADKVDAADLSDEERAVLDVILARAAAAGDDVEGFVWRGGWSGNVHGAEMSAETKQLWVTDWSNLTDRGTIYARGLGFDSSDLMPRREG